MKRRRFLQALPVAAAAVPATVEAQHSGFARHFTDAPPLTADCRYSVENGAITIANGGYYNNRPLYCAHIPAAALGGDRPLVRLIQEHEVAGVFSIGLLRGNSGKWLDEFDAVRMEYRCGHLRWHATDPTWPGLKIVLEVVPLSDRAGFAARLQAEGSSPDDQLVWSFGGAHEAKNAMWSFDPVLMPQDEGYRERLSGVLQRGFEPDKCSGNEVRIEAGELRVNYPGAKRITTVSSDAAGPLHIGDALSRLRLTEFVRSTAGSAPLGFGVVALDGERIVHWNVEHQGPVTQTAPPVARSFTTALDNVKQLGERVVVRTPEPRLDAAVNAALHAVDAIHYPPVFRHGCMAWNVRLPGWRTMYGGTVFGWHERVLAQARFYLASQVKESNLRVADPEPRSRLCEQSSRSRLNGVGRIPLDAGHYDFQSQMFDQLIHAWRWTGSPELHALLRETLPLHAEWMRECFDPDGDGLYESYINTWPTDTVWYNGGGSVEESSYAYTVHRALADMEQIAGNSSAAERHRDAAAHIQRSLARVLWVKDKGHFAAYIEQGGYRRVHEDAWLYSQFLPIDAGLCSHEEAVQALHYCEWALENVRPPFGGRRVWTSNWVPSKWSVRELYHGDNYHLALAHFQAGITDQGWELLLGNLLDSAYARIVPGSQSTAGAGTDFGDILHPFCRVVVEGLFGYVPDLPNGVVVVRPGWPADWSTAAIETPDFALRFERKGNTEAYDLTLRRPAVVHFRLPVRAERIRRVTCNGAEAQYKTEPGFGCSIIEIKQPQARQFELTVDVEQRVQHVNAQSVSGKVGAAVRLAPPLGHVTGLRDLNGVLSDAVTETQGVRATLAAKAGHHIVLLKTKVGDLDQWATCRVCITAPETDARRSTYIPRATPRNGDWSFLDLGPVYNGDVRRIFQQQYLSPRPATVSVRLGVDGYSPWTFAPWKIDPPQIDLSHVGSMTNDKGVLTTPQGARFAGIGGERNIAFTSLWDNWPARVTVPAGVAADSIWLLVAGSTNPMQTKIANAVLTFRYRDGANEQLELVPPLNFWSLCHLGGRDYSYERDAFCLPQRPPATVQFGNNCRAMLLSHKLRSGVPLDSISLEALSQEVVIGLMGVSLARERRR